MVGSFAAIEDQVEEALDDDDDGDDDNDDDDDNDNGDDDDDDDEEISKIVYRFLLLGIIIFKGKLSFILLDPCLV
ncbi:hypothetical protein RJT34_06052 [Clitoria ternatea]|uniref:Uncharacterized protein n=1 Tax=Clitoria ternatea TaxID=43366 RepID=A0AAN9PTG6_CLITE